MHHLEFPLYRPRQSRHHLLVRRIKKHLHKYGLVWFCIFVTFSVVLAAQMPSEACAGWLCGVKDKLNATEGWKNGKILWDMLFVGAQALIALLFGVVGVIGVVKARADESYKEYFLFLLLFFLALLAANYGADYVMGGEQGSGTAATKTTSALIKFLMG
jgi:hypothetical protein